MSEPLILDVVRTPRGRAGRSGALVGTPPTSLVATLMHALDARAPGAGEHVEDVILGCSTVTGEQGADVARAAALLAGWSDDASGAVVSRLCCSGLDALATGAAKVSAGQHALVAAGGVESMSRVPMFSDRAPLFADPSVAAQAGFVHMGVAADLVAALDDTPRAELDALAAASHARAAHAHDAGHFARSLIPVADLLDHDEAVRGGTTVEQLAALEPAFPADETAARIIRERLPDAPAVTPRHTVATAPQMVDGASLALIGTARAGARLGLQPRGRIIGHGSAGVRAPLLTSTVPAVERALAHAGATVEDVDLWEVNESFAAPVLHLTGRLEVDPAIVNVDGGALAMGHPLGATGGILLATLLDALDRTDGTLGVLTIPAASGIGAALVVERL